MTHASFILIYLASYSVDVDRISVNKTFMDFKMRMNVGEQERSSCMVGKLDPRSILW